MLTIEALKEYGANVDEGLSRLMGNEALYIRLVNVACEDKHFDMLQKSLAAGDYNAAFEDAHALKGAISNLSLTPLQEKISVLTDALRKREEGDYSQQLQQVLEEKKRLDTLRTG